MEKVNDSSDQEIHLDYRSLDYFLETKLKRDLTNLSGGRSLKVILMTGHSDL